MCQPELVEHLYNFEPREQSVFGSSVAVSGDTAFVGVYMDVVDGVESGSVHLFRFDGENWVFEDRISPTDGESGQIFGVWLSVDDDSLLIGSQRDNDLGENSGSVYAYRLIDEEWVFIQKILASDGAPEDGFGVLEQENGRVVIGAPGSVSGNSPGAIYIFEFDGEAWNEVQKITASDGENGDVFGISPKLRGDRLIVGAPWDRDELFTRHGSVYVFEYDDSQWVQSAKLEPAVSDFNRSFGFELAISEDLIFVGDPSDYVADLFGAVVVFAYVDGAWSETQTLIPEFAGDVSGFGSGVIVNQDELMLIGAPFTDKNAGIVFIYRLIDGVWVQSGTIENPSAQSDSLFGARMGLDGDTAMIASPRADENIGSVSVYDLGCIVCNADITGDGSLNYFDLSAFISAFLTMDLKADFDNNGIHDFADVTEFLNAYSNGCP